MLITSSNWCFTNINSYGLFHPYVLITYLKTVLYISTIIYQFFGDAEQILGNLKYMSLNDLIFQVTQIQVTIFCPLTSMINLL